MDVRVNKDNGDWDILSDQVIKSGNVEKPAGIFGAKLSLSRYAQDYPDCN